MKDYINNFNSITYNAERYLQTKNPNNEFLVIPIDEDDYVIEIKGLSKYFFDLVLNPHSGSSASELVAELGRLYKISDAQVKNDVNHFIQDLAGL